MKERPILFSGEMVRAILDGRKTQTRRVVRPDEDGYPHRPGDQFGERDLMKCPYGKPGDRLWVREAWGEVLNASVNHTANEMVTVYREDYERHEVIAPLPKRWRPSIHMPRKASRILLEIIDIRVERVQEITFQECLKEGVLEAPSMPYMPYQKSTVNDFRELWDSINGSRGYGWAANPWVWVLEFRMV